MARITYQRFFRRYLHLCGMTGTAWEVRKELWSVYGLAVSRIPTEKPLRRSRLPDVIVPSAAVKRRVVLERVEGFVRRGRPVLIGTRSVAASEELSGCFTEAGLDHRVLNAKNDSEEAAIVAEAGSHGAITIATNMAGRGTDIKLGPGVAELGGLHVILTERHDAGRIDRQLAGRCGRQGDPGSFEAILSMEDSLLEGGRAGAFGWVGEAPPASRVLSLDTCLENRYITCSAKDGARPWPREARASEAGRADGHASFVLGLGGIERQCS